jgi:hypothetical protein
MDVGAMNTPTRDDVRAWTEATRMASRVPPVVEDLSAAAEVAHALRSGPEAREQAS